MPETTLALDSPRLRSRIAELHLKQWWLAEQLGVDRRTVLRWVNGQVRQIQAAHAERLAGLLDVPVSHFTRPDAEHGLATEADQRKAAHALAAGRLLERLGPQGEWHIAEQLLRASIVPRLPLQVLAPLYYQLGVACWRQDKLDEASRHNATAMEMAQRCGDRALQARTLGSRANLHFWRGAVSQALADYRQALSFADVLSPQILGGMHTNLGAALYETGALEEGRAHLQQSLAHLATGGTPMNHAIVWGHLATLALKEDDAAAAEAANKQAQQWSERAEYRRGLAFASLVRAELASQRGEAQLALDELEQADRAFAALGIEDAPDQLLAARLLHRLGHADAASARLARAEERARGFPLEQAAVQRERQRLGMPPRVTRRAG